MQPDDLDSVSHWYFAVGGLRTTQALLPVNRAIELRRLGSYPEPEHLAQRLHDLTTAGFMAHYGEAVIQHELVFDAGQFGDYEEVVLTAGLVMAALRIRTAAEVICPAVCERSWGDMRGTFQGQRWQAYRVEQIMLDHQLDRAYAIVPEDLEWAARSLGPLWQLTVEKDRRDERFAIAVEALCSYLHAGNYRMMATQLWAGIEALFDVQYEVKYRLATLIARLLEKHGPKCREKYEQVKGLYDERSKLVHGRKMKAEALKQHVADVRTLLAQLLERLIARGKVPSRDEFDDLVFLPDKQ